MSLHALKSVLDVLNSYGFVILWKLTSDRTQGLLPVNAISDFPDHLDQGWHWGEWPRIVSLIDLRNSQNMSLINFGGLSQKWPQNGQKGDFKAFTGYIQCFSTPRPPSLFSEEGGLGWKFLRRGGGARVKIFPVFWKKVAQNCNKNGFWTSFSEISGKFLKNFSTFFRKKSRKKWPFWIAQKTG